MISPQHKFVECLKRILNTTPHPTAVMIFVSDGKTAEKLVQQLYRDHDIIAAALHGETEKEDRAEIMKRLRKDQSLGVVITTDVASRGIDAAHITHVINYDLPSNVESYVHRAGRCGRAGQTGCVITLVKESMTFVLEKYGKILALQTDKDVEKDGYDMSVITK